MLICSKYWEENFIGRGLVTTAPTQWSRQRPALSIKFRWVGRLWSCKFFFRNHDFEYSCQVGWTAPSSSNNQPACLLLTGTIMASPESSLLNTKIHSNNPPLPESRILRSPAPVSSPSPYHQFESYSSPTNDSLSHQTHSSLSSFTSQSTLRLCQSLHKRW